ncbi:MAG: redoxin domain-containing protein [Ignavibacteriaceae bacterium]|nr:redoxin domain-containing protein [Ignavibacteriaceae bacterium]
MSPIKKSAAIFFVLFSLLTTSIFAQNFSFKPEKPKSGETITVMFDAAGTELADIDKITVYVYSFASDLLSTQSIEMKKEEGRWTAEFTPDEKSLGVSVKFINSETVVNNKGAGYFIGICDETGNVLPGYKAGIANAVNNWGVYYLDLDRDMEKAINLFEEDFAANPSIKNEFLGAYLPVVNRVRVQEKDSIITAALEEFAKTSNDDEKDLTLLLTGYGVVKNQEKGEVYKAKLEEKYPQCDFLANIKVGEIYNEKDLTKKEELLKTFVETFPTSKMLSTAFTLYINALRSAGEFNKAKDFITVHKNEIQPYTFYSLADKMFDAENLDFAAIKVITELGVEKSKKELENPTEEQPNYQSKSDWEKDRKYLLGLNLYAFGKALFKEGAKDEAKDVLEDAVEYTANEEADVNELYAQTLLETGNADEAITILSSVIKDGKGNDTIKELLKKSYVQEKGSDKGLDTYLNELDQAAKEKITAALKKQMKNDPAPEFTLTDTEGKTVSLADYKGKIVILDFWATWCGPCKSSFPGMQKAINKYADDDNVKFLFVNTWERVDNKLKNAQDFITENKYTFRVLMDETNEVITKYKVSGIPTKFIIGKDGNIKFIAVGFSGNADQMVDEISTMIAMLQ